MTKEQFDKKYQELVNRVPSVLMERADFLQHSGAIDFGEYEDNYTLPKVVLSVACNYVAELCYPYTKKNQKTVANLLKF